MKCRFFMLLIFVIPLAGCEDGDPIVIKSQTYLSPDGAYSATLEVVDNGLGFGQVALYDEVHLTRQGESIGKHGDTGHSVAVYAESAYQEASEVKVTWMDSQHLRVEYGREQHPGRMVTKLHGVAIEFLPAKP